MARPKLHSVKVSGGTYGGLLDLAGDKNPDELADRLLGEAIARERRAQDRQQREARYLAAEEDARKNNRPTPLKRDFGLPE